MTDRTSDISLRKAALVAGFGYIIIFVLGFFAFALENLNCVGRCGNNSQQNCGL
jgi:hypothetical protein